MCLFALWILFAIGTNTKLLSNRVLKYLSNISMEIYLSHMIIYRVIEKAHLENYISQNDILYIVTSILTICGVICFAHIMKYYVMNKVENKLLQKK